MTSEMGELFNDWKAGKRRLRELHGRNCPKCNEKEPNRTPSILLPQQRCRVDGYVDPRPRLTEEQYEEATGFRKV